MRSSSVFGNPLQNGGALDESSPDRSRVCAAIVTYNIGQSIQRCYRSIQGQVDQVVIVDNCSDKSTVQELRNLARDDSVRLILNQANEGIGRALNQAVEWARGRGFQWILTLDHDSEATPGMVEKLLKAFVALRRAGNQHVALVSANPFDRNTETFISHPPMSQGDTPLEEESVLSSGSLILIQAFDVVGPFNENLFLYYVDTDFCFRLRQAGFRIFRCPGAVLLHTLGSKRAVRFLGCKAFYDDNGKYARYFLSRNSIYMLRKYFARLGFVYWMALRFCKDHLKTLLYDKERFTVLWFSMRGLMDGLRGRWGALNTGGAAGRRNG